MVVGAKHGLKIKMINKKQTKINRKEYQKERFTKNKLNVWKMYIYSDAYRFLEYIYSDTNFKYYLGRKYNIYLKNINKRKTVRHFRKICQYDSNMNLIKTWNTQQEIANSLKCPATTLNTYLNKFKNKIYINYYWRYENEQ